MTFKEERNKILGKKAKRTVFYNRMDHINSEQTSSHLENRNLWKVKFLNVENRSDKRGGGRGMGASRDDDSD